MTKTNNFIVRLILTAILVAWAIFPFLTNSSNDSILREVFKIGIIPSTLILAGFFVMVAFYCRTLQKCLTLIKPHNRKANPKSVWYMFAIPFNFVEDFFIIINIANSIEKEKETNEKLSTITDFGMVSGIGWSLAQILSFIPNIVGQIAGFFGLVLVIYHWVLIHNINKILEHK